MSDVVYLKTLKWRSKYPEKRAAHQAVFVAVRAGKLVKKLCRVCRKKKVEAHHTDYSKPLKVIWLCKKHHIQADKRLRSLSPTRHDSPVDTDSDIA